MVEQGTQTQTLDEEGTSEDLTMHERQLDAAHEKAGAKSREFIRAQEQVAALQEQLRLQTRLAEQYKDEVQTMEEQLQATHVLRQRAEDDKNIVEWRLRQERSSTTGARSGSQTPRCHSSAGQAWKAGDDADSGSCRRGAPRLSEVSTGASSLRSTHTPRCWSASRRARTSGGGDFLSLYSCRDEEASVEEDASWVGGSAKSPKAYGTKDDAAFEESMSSDDDEIVMPLPPRLQTPRLRAAR